LLLFARLGARATGAGGQAVGAQPGPQSAAQQFSVRKATSSFIASKLAA
jgi:hypothetical protein